MAFTAPRSTRFFLPTLSLLLLFGSFLRAAATDQPLSVKDLCLMLRSGYSPAEILRDTASRSLLEPLDFNAEKALLQAGADLGFIASLKAGRRTLTAQEAALSRQRQSELDIKESENRQLSRARLAELERQAAISHSPQGPSAAPPLAAPNGGKTSVDPASVKPAQIEIRDVLQNDAMPVANGHRLAVIWDSGAVLSVSLIGPDKVSRSYIQSSGESITQDYLRIRNTKVPKTHPILLPGSSNKAYLIYSDNEAQYYFVDAIVKNGGAFRIAKVIN